MHTMSLYESGESTGEVSLSALFDGEMNFDALSSLDMDDIAYLLCRGGWPEVLDMEKEQALAVPNDHYRSIIVSGISEVDFSM